MAATQEPVQRPCRVNPAKSADSWRGVPGATTGRLCPGSRTQWSRSHPLPEPGGLESLGTLLNQSAGRRPAFLSGLSRQVGLEERVPWLWTDKPALQTKGRHFFFSYEKSSNKYSRLCGPYSLWCSWSTLSLQDSSCGHAWMREAMPTEARLAGTGRGRCADPAAEEWAMSGAPAQSELRAPALRHKEKTQ